MQINDNALRKYLQGKSLDGAIFEEIKALSTPFDEAWLNQLAADIHENAVAHGWWEEERTLPEILMLCVSELSEALEEFRDGKTPGIYYFCKYHDTRTKCPDQFDGCRCGKNADCTILKPEGIDIELADCIIRILDYCGRVGIDIGSAIAVKHKYNKGREYRHGGKKC